MCNLTDVLEQRHFSTSITQVMRLNSLALAGSQRVWLLEITHYPYTFLLNKKILVSTEPLVIKALKNCSHLLPENLLTAGTFG